MIFGTQAPKFSDRQTDVLLDHSIILKDEPEYNNLIHTSVIDGTRRLIEKGYYWNFEINLYLMKYRNPLAKYLEIISFMYKPVALFRHRDHEPVKDKNGSIVNFILTEVTPFYIEQDEHYDALLLKFISEKYVDISASTEAVITDGKGSTVSDALPGNNFLIL